MRRLHQMAAPCREPTSRFLSSLNKSSLGRTLSKCCPCSRALGSWPTSPPGSTRSVFGKTTLEHLPLPAMCRPLRSPINSCRCLMHFSSHTKSTGCSSSQEAWGTGSGAWGHQSPSCRHHLDKSSRVMLMPDPPNPALPSSRFPVFRRELHQTHLHTSNSISDPTKPDCSQILVSTLASKHVQVCALLHNQHLCSLAFAFFSLTHFNIMVQVR